MVTIDLPATLALTLQPAFTQSPGAETMLPGTNPALVQPRLLPAPEGPLSQGATLPLPVGAVAEWVSTPVLSRLHATKTAARRILVRPQPSSDLTGPPALKPGRQAAGFQSGPAPNQPGPSALIAPMADRGVVCAGLRECLINRDPKLPVFDKNTMRQSGVGSPQACQAAWETDR